MATTAAQADAIGGVVRDLVAAFKAQAPEGVIGTTAEREAWTEAGATVDAYIAAGGDAEVLAALARLADAIDRVDVLLGLYDPALPPGLALDFSDPDQAVGVALMF